jgi:TonB-linked SusC/RagA family outer membrane protein
MRKFTLFLAFIFLVGMQILQAQDRDISGTVTSSDDGQGIPGVQVLIKGTQLGVTTDLDGKFTLKVPASATTLIFKYVGMGTQEIPIGTQTTFKVVMSPDVLNIEGVVVTALGISREKKSLGYATQELGGEEINQIKTDNFVNSLAGKVAGVQIKSNGNMGGSTNILIRGSSSITGNNQALFVVDGVPIGNNNTNTTDQIRGRSGFDYGSAASDINPNDIETISVLKGAAATALYGSRAANGVIMITTKKGTKMTGKKKVYGVNISSNVTTGFIDKSTFPKYQQNYGGGYGAQFYSETDHPGLEYLYDINEDGITDFTVPTYEDASFGEKFDPSLMVYQWDSFDPENPNYQKATPWIAGENGPDYFFETPWSFTNSVDVTGGGENSAFRLGYTNLDETGIMPNSSIKKNNFMFNGSYDVLKNLKVSASANYINTKGKGRNSTGYSDNILSSFRQWMQMNVDYKQQQEIYDETGRNITWNPVSPYDLAPAYWDNPYWVRFENFETDQRDRIIAYLQVDYDLNDYFNIMGRYSVDTYNEIQEERKAFGSAAGEFGVPTTAGRSDVTSGYSKLDYSYTERNMDLMLKFHKNLTEDFNLSALLGTNIRRLRTDQLFAATDGGLIVPGLYAVNNSVNTFRSAEELQELGVNGYYISASLGFKNFLYLDGTFRNDVSSTLPSEEWSYQYPSVSASFVFSELAKASWLDHGKFRISWAQVGNDAQWGSLINTYDQNPTYNGTALYSLPNQNNNANLKPEISSGLEGGLEMYFLKKRLGFDLALYQANTINQLFPVAVSYATGFSSNYVNAGEVSNKGIELTLFGAPVKKGNFTWDVTLNWARNINEVVSLEGDIENLQLSALQGGLTINARVGEPYGTIQGTDFIYVDGQKVVGADGYYRRTPTSDIVLGNINPDWNAGFLNRFSYKNWMLSILIDWQQGGSVFSLDQYYGLGTGLYEETDYTNDLGNPVRNSLEDGGGLILDGLIENVDEDGNGLGTYRTNDVRVAGDDYRVFGWSRNPNAKFVYDATYIKLREVVLTYSLPGSLLDKTFINGISFSLVGSNLWIISKDLPHADPESGHTGGNIQGWQSGVMPTTRNIGLTVNLQF